VQPTTQLSLRHTRSISISASIIIISPMPLCLRLCLCLVLAHYPSLSLALRGSLSRPHSTVCVSVFLARSPSLTVLGLVRVSISASLIYCSCLSCLRLCLSRSLAIHHCPWPCAGLFPAFIHVSLSASLSVSRTRSLSWPCANLFPAFNLLRVCRLLYLSLCFSLAHCPSVVCSPFTMQVFGLVPVSVFLACSPSLSVSTPILPSPVFLRLARLDPVAFPHLSPSASLCRRRRAVQ
jgi:hypothetical protein